MNERIHLTKLEFYCGPHIGRRHHRSKLTDNFCCVLDAPLMIIGKVKNKKVVKAEFFHFWGRDGDANFS